MTRSTPEATWSHSSSSCQTNSKAMIVEASSGSMSLIPVVPGTRRCCPSRSQNPRLPDHRSMIPPFHPFPCPRSTPLSENTTRETMYRRVPNRIPSNPHLSTSPCRSAGTRTSSSRAGTGTTRTGGECTARTLIGNAAPTRLTRRSEQLGVVPLALLDLQSRFVAVHRGIEQCCKSRNSTKPTDLLNHVDNVLVVDRLVQRDVGGTLV